MRDVRGDAMKISFLITFFNQVTLVDTSMKSILAIDMPDEWEVLVGDDGSTDGTVEKIQKYVDQYPEHIRLFTRNPEDKKQLYYRDYLSTNRLRMLDEATGDCFCLLDGDDWYIDTSFVKEAIEILEREPDISIVMYGYRCFSNNAYIGVNLTLARGGKIDGKAYLENGWYVHAGACVYRNCYDSARRALMKEHAFFNDNEVVYNSLNYGNIYSVQRAVYGYRIHADSMWHSMSSIQAAVDGTMSIDICSAVMDKRLMEGIEKRSEQSVIELYAFRDEIKSISAEKRAQIRKKWQRYSPSPRYDLFRYEELSPVEFRRMKKQLIYGKQWKVAALHLEQWRGNVSNRMKDNLIPWMNKLPYIRRLVAENEGLRKRLDELSKQLAELQGNCEQ